VSGRPAHPPPREVADEPAVAAARPIVSVVMPAFNAAATIVQSIASVLAQTHRAIELIVVDDGSTDGTVGIVEDVGAVDGVSVRLLHQRHEGPYPARNRALRAASGQFIAFLDADDTWRPDCLASLLAALLRDDADIAYCGWQNVGPAAPGTEPFVPPAYEEGDLVAAGLRGCPWPIHAALTRRSALEAVGGFSERMFSAMDYDLWIRLFAHTRRLVRVPEVMAYYHWRGGQISSDRSRQILDAVRVRREFVQRHRDLVAHLPRQRITELIDGYLAERAYEALWRREAGTAQKLFRAYCRAMHWRFRDLPYCLLAALPASVFAWLLSHRDAR
jgi:glycosyltransferase involved in cell wall biosynthesis